MFSGFIQALSPVLEVKEKDSLLKIKIKRPSSFKNLKVGESIAVNGVCLTLEKFSQKDMVFSLAFESLKVTKWTKTSLKKNPVNLERSISLKTALNGQIVVGHVEGLAKALSIKKKGEARILKIKVPKSHSLFFWKKGFITLNGVSLTINEIKDEEIEICLIPKTLSSTNLQFLKKGDFLTFEVDYLARACFHFAKNKKALKI